MIYDQMAKAKAKQQVAIEVTHKATWDVAKGDLLGKFYQLKDSLSLTEKSAPSFSAAVLF